MINVIAPCSKLRLRKLYHDHDVLVLPSLGDSFGFVAMEAMGCGLPVVVTDNCGVPVPDSSWRVPIMDSDAIARRLALYAGDRVLCRDHGMEAVKFARQSTPERYRERVKTVLQQLLAPVAA
jgi:glycosyltransferase involved in cell wall biosynthesis